MFLVKISLDVLTVIFTVCCILSFTFGVTFVLGWVVHQLNFATEKSTLEMGGAALAMIIGSALLISEGWVFLKSIGQWLKSRWNEEK